MTFSPPLVKCDMSSSFNSHVERGSCIPSNQTNGDMCFLSLLAMHDGWINTGANTGNFHSHIFTHALRLYFFSRLLSQDKPSLGKAIRVQQDMHVFQSMEENTIGDAPPFFVSLNTAPRDIFRLGLCHYRVSR